MKVIVLIAVTATAGLVLVPAAGLVFGAGHWLPAAFGFAVCLPPAVMTLAVAERLSARSAELGAGAALLGSGVRLASALAMVAVLEDKVAELGVPRDRFLGWVTTFYLVTLAAESGLLMWGANRPVRSAP